MGSSAMVARFVTPRWDVSQARQRHAMMVMLVLLMFAIQRATRVLAPVTTPVRFQAVLVKPAWVRMLTMQATTNAVRQMRAWVV
jgi:hypothetical protein